MPNEVTLTLASDTWTTYGLDTDVQKDGQAKRQRDRQIDIMSIYSIYSIPF